MKYIFVENSVLNGAGEAESLDTDVINVEVSETVYNAYLAEPYKYVYSNGNIVENPEYETEKQKVTIQKRINEIYEELDLIDAKRIRAVCENEVKDIETGETWLEYYNSLILDLRTELNGLESQI